MNAIGKSWKVSNLNKKGEREIPVSYLHQLFFERDGVLYWRAPKANWIKPGDRAGYVSPRGYIQVRIVFNGVSRLIFAHRVLWALYYGEWPTTFIDHKNRNKSDNTKENLRLATKAQNSMNRERQSNNTSGHKGITAYKYGWIARINLNGKSILKKFRSLVDALEWRQSKENEYYGEFANYG